jgi:hypothetical protein
MVNKKESGGTRKMKKLTLTLVAAFFGGLPLAAGAVTLTFDEFPLGTVVSNQYAPQGVVFLQGTNGNFPIISLDGAMPTAPVLSPNPIFAGDFTARFPSGARDVSFISGFWDTVNSGEIQVFDRANVLLGTFTNTTTGVQAFNFDSLGAIINQPDLVIGAISFNSLADPAGADIDNLTFSPVPEPATLLLLGSSLAGLGGVAWRRKRRN